MSSKFNIQEELKKLPDKPGVYIMHDVNDAIIYVGKAIILKNRGEFKITRYYPKHDNVLFLFRQEKYQKKPP